MSAALNDMWLVMELFQYKCLIELLAKANTDITFKGSCSKDVLLYFNWLLHFVTFCFSLLPNTENIVSDVDKYVSIITNVHDTLQSQIYVSDMHRGVHMNIFQLLK